MPRLLIPAAGDEPVVVPVSTHVCVTTPQLSAVVGFGVVTVPEQSPASVLAWIFEGQVMVGFSASLTVTVNEQVELPQIFVAVTVTVVVPVAKRFPLPLPLPLPLLAPLMVYVKAGAGAPVTMVL